MKCVRSYVIALLLSSLLWGCVQDDVEDIDGEYRELLLLQQADSSRRFEGGVRFGFPDGGTMGADLPFALKVIRATDHSMMQVQHIKTNTTIFSGTIFPYAQGERVVPAVLDSAGTFIRQQTIPEVDPKTVTWLTTPPDTTGQALLSLWSKIDDLNLVARFMAVPHVKAIFHYSPSEGHMAGDVGKYYWVFYR